MDHLLTRVTFLVPILLSLSVHEWAHAWTAWRLGDDTAKRLGRLTLNPLAHADPVGTFLLPLLGVPFGWAKPVPINPLRFRREVDMRTGLVLTAVAGPLSNVVLAVACGTLLVASHRLVPGLLLGGDGAVAHLLHVGVYLNVLLAVFNLLPIPPLDGSRVVDGLLPDGPRAAWEHLSAYGWVALAGVLIVPALLGYSPFGSLIARIERLLSVLMGSG